MRSFKFFLNFDKEEKWLNEMGMQGFIFVGKSFGYRFMKNKPENPNIKIDYRVFKNMADFEDYKALFEDSGWKHISGTRNSGAQYFRLIHNGASEDIFSDTPSKAGRYKRLSELYISLVFMYLPVFIALLASNAVELESIINLKGLYYTQGLWDKSGSEFWSAFLFETPFAIFRGFLWMFFPIAIGLFLLFSLKAEKQYRKSLENNSI